MDEAALAAVREWTFSCRASWEQTRRESDPRAVPPRPSNGGRGGRRFFPPETPTPASASAPSPTSPAPAATGAAATKAAQVPAGPMKGREATATNAAAPPMEPAKGDALSGVEDVSVRGKLTRRNLGASDYTSPWESSPRSLGRTPRIHASWHLAFSSRTKEGPGTRSRSFSVDHSRADPESVGDCPSDGPHGSSFWQSFAEDSPVHLDQIAAQYVGVAAADGGLIESRIDDFHGVPFQPFTDHAGTPIPWRNCAGTYYTLPGNGAMFFTTLSVPVCPGASDPNKCIHDYYDYIRYTQSTQGHLNSQGNCYIDRQFPAPSGGS
jgi:hypothetical protein